MHGRQPAECMHLSHAARFEHCASPVSLSSLRVLNSLVSQHATRHVVVLARKVRQLQSTHIDSVFSRRTSDRPCFPRVLVEFRPSFPWFGFGSVPIVAGFIVAIFIDIEHLIIPDEITIGGTVVGFLLSAAVPQLHNTLNRAEALKLSGLGIVVGGGIVYLILRAGKMAFGKKKIEFPPDSKIIFTETSLQLPDAEYPFEELFIARPISSNFTQKRLS